jgi:hypothetical protein
MDEQTKQQMQYGHQELRRLDVAENKELAPLGRRMRRLCKTETCYTNGAVTGLLYEAAAVQRRYDYQRRTVEEMMIAHLMGNRRGWTKP